MTLLLLLASAPAAGQTTSALVLDPWTHSGWGETLDRLQYQAQADVRGTSGDQTTQLFLWDSTGRFRLAKDSPTDPRIGYRYLTINTDSNSRTLPDTLDEISLAAGLRLGEAAGGRVSVVLGAGYSGDNPFADADGLFGIAHLLWERKLNERDALVLSLDYDGSRSLLPDVPLPGFAFAHDGDGVSYRLGFPRSSLDWRITSALSLSANYAVPYTGDLTLRYQLDNRWSVFGGYGSFFNAFYLDDEPRTDRFFLQQQRVELGVRFVEPDLWGKGLYVDVAVRVGYAFDQAWSRGFDVRGLDPVGRTDDTPFVGLVVRGRF
ncbi:MAG TPA: hypothetical protein VF796_11065 [Humisphaera sp.]